MITNHNKRLSGSLEETLNIYFSEPLVDDVIKLRLAPSGEPDYDSAHLGISVLAVILMSARTQVAWDEEVKVKAAATVVTMSDVKASRKGPPPSPCA